ncbi:hypothetical protein TrST_g13109 [Triparma strigata]|uniref:glutamine--tRNA ligase n=1 Tax=Triparma strigata TaxID=1606541 RepID=A0A9W7C487_9STRA|nr:hypothetical protein TrST_g13109 [Triparma strigata]
MSSVTNSDALVGRPIPVWDQNTPSQASDHAKANGNVVRTRFPPEPNGYLHIGHAKSMNMNFSLAFEKLGVAPENRETYFRYDDTNPEKESKEYIDSLLNDLTWLGWKPAKTTYSSESFEFLHDCAVKLIKKGLAYVCFLTKEEVEKQREVLKKRVAVIAKGGDPDKQCESVSTDIFPGKYRNTSIADNLRLFEDMRKGKFPEGHCTLRMKMDITSPNPNMHDSMAYRIKYTRHPHAGDGWCMYPSYDFTHCIIDSLEGIDYSICTLEFETRRESYYWLLWALDLYKPRVYEMSRLNIAHTVLSKRRLLKLVESKTVRGWDDPRMPTISGLRRRGYTKECLNTFCNDIGATRNMNLVEVNRLEQAARVCLADVARRAMAVVDPVKVTISNFSGESKTCTVPNFPQNPALGSHDVIFTPTFYIDSADVKPEADANFFGFAPTQLVGLKYADIKVRCDEVKVSGGKVVEVTCSVTDEDTKPKSYLTWVSAVHNIPCEVRKYDHLFSVPEPSDKWEEEVNASSEVVYSSALVDPSVASLCNAGLTDKWKSNNAFQFERIGYFVVDDDTTYVAETGKGKIVFNSIVSLKEDVAKTTKKDATASAAADAQRQRQAILKARLSISKSDFFKKVSDYAGMFSKYDEEGFPTHDAKGEEVKKSAAKKLKKELAKHEKALANAAKAKK